MKNIYTLLIAVLTMYNASAQKTNIVAEYVILKAEHNDVDYSEIYRAKNARLVFYEENGETYLINQQDNSASFGEIHIICHEHHKETADNPSYTIYRFLWFYENNYDDRKGVCLVNLRETYHEPATTFVLVMVTEDLNISTYKGYEDDK